MRMVLTDDVKLVDAKLLNYKSILGADIRVQPDITCLVGTAGAGKTSVLELLSRINSRQGFTEDDLPAKSATAGKFQKGEVSAGRIKHLIARFDVEDADRRHLPDGCGSLTRVTLTRFFDGGQDIELEWSGEPACEETGPDAGRTERIRAELDEQVAAAQARIPMPPEDRAAYDAARKSLGECMRDDPDGMGRMVASLKNTFLFMRQDEQLRAGRDEAMAGLESVSKKKKSRQGFKRGSKARSARLCPGPNTCHACRNLQTACRLTST